MARMLFWCSHGGFGSGLVVNRRLCLSRNVCLVCLWRRSTFNGHAWLGHSICKQQYEDSWNSYLQDMRSLAEARESWQSLQSHESLTDLKEAIRTENEPDSLTKSRSLLWKVRIITCCKNNLDWWFEQIFLLFEGLDHSEWLQRSADSRSAYASVRSHLLRGLEHPEEVLGSNLDPLSEDSEVYYIHNQEWQTLPSHW